MSDLITLATALAAFVISLVTLLHLVRQRKNEIRPVLVLIERPHNGESSDELGLYLVNMGNAAALDIRLSWTRAGVEGPKPLQVAVAAGRRLALDTGYHGSRLHEVALTARYCDLDGDDHTMTFTPGRHAGEPGRHNYERPADLWRRVA